MTDCLYLPNSAGKNTPQLDCILPNGGPATRSYYDAAGNLIDNGKLTFAYGEDRRLEQTGKYDSGTTYTYDGRGFLHQGTRIFPEYRLTDPPRTDETEPTYGSTGLLHHRFSHWNLTPHSPVSPTRDSDLYLFHFAGRPIATLDSATEGAPATGYTTTATWQYLTTDHLGTPILLTNPTGAELWQGGFEPFGADYSSAPTVLRFPGQWVDETWGEGKDGGLYYNVHRWYEAGRGRYTQVDPLIDLDTNSYDYPGANPLIAVDPLGLFCQVPPQWRRCLQAIFGAPIQEIRIHNHSSLRTALHNGMITTRLHSIYLPRNCRGFWRHSETVLHEYYHVIDQWSSERLTPARYARESLWLLLTGRDLHDDNHFEIEADNFARIHRKSFEDCVACQRLPPESPAPPPATVPANCSYCATQ